MNILKESTFNKLTEVHKPHCVSIYIPTQRAGGPKGIQEDRIRFKNQLKEVSHKLSGFGLKEPEIKKYLTPARELLEDENMWSHLSDGLAVFLYGDQMEHFIIPISFEEKHHIGESLYLLPIVPLLADAGRHFIMALSMNEIRFFEATRNSVTRVVVEGLIPQTLEEAVGQDTEQQSLQFRSGQGMAPESAIFHGQGAGEMPEKKEELEKYFHKVNDGLMKMLHDEKAPLVIACVDYLYPIYKECNSYKHLAGDFIEGNHERTDPVSLKEMSWDIVGDKFDKDREKELARFNERLSVAKASFNEEEVIPAGIIGQAETLFVRKGSEIWGKYNPENHKVTIDDVQRVGNAELINRAAVETIKHGGKVLYASDDKLPEEIDTVAATYRYSM